jgi:hypothetical protein
MFGGSDSRFARLETLLGAQADTSKRIEESIKEYRDETKEALKHDRANNAAKFDAIERTMDDKVTKADLAANQKQSDDRYDELRRSYAGKWTEKVLAAIGMAIVMGFFGVLIKIAMPEDRPQHQTMAIHAPVAPTTQTR